jgi:hypothetical protein
MSAWVLPIAESRAFAYVSGVRKPTRAQASVLLEAASVFIIIALAGAARRAWGPFAGLPILALGGLVTWHYWKRVRALRGRDEWPR